MEKANVLTPERISELALEAYRRLGYQTITFRDGSVGVVGCPTKTVALMNAFQEALMNEVEPPAPVDPPPVEAPSDAAR